MNPPKMPVHIGDFLRDTGHLGAAGVGAYLLLLFHHWSTGSLPDDEEQLARIARLSKAEWGRMGPILAKFFGEGWRHGRVEEDLEAAKASYEKRAAAGAEGGKASGKAKAAAKQNGSNATAGLKQPLTFNQGKNSEANASAPPNGTPVYTDSRHELWGEGIPILVSLGVAEKQARSMIGTWLKSTKDDAQAVLGAIQRARDHRAHNPIPWITNALKDPNHARSGSDFTTTNGQQSRSTAILAGVAAAAERRFGSGRPGTVPAPPDASGGDDPELFGGR